MFSFSLQLHATLMIMVSSTLFSKIKCQECQQIWNLLKEIKTGCFWVEVSETFRHWPLCFSKLKIFWLRHMNSRFVCFRPFFTNMTLKISKKKWKIDILVFLISLNMRNEQLRRCFLLLLYFVSNKTPKFKWQKKNCGNRLISSLI